MKQNLFTLVSYSDTTRTVMAHAVLTHLFKGYDITFQSAGFNQEPYLPERLPEKFLRAVQTVRSQGYTPKQAPQKLSDLQETGLVLCMTPTQKGYLVSRGYENLQTIGEFIARPDFKIRGIQNEIISSCADSHLLQLWHKYTARLQGKAHKDDEEKIEQLYQEKFTQVENMCRIISTHVIINQPE